MVRTHHKGQPTIVTDQPFIIALQFNYSCLGIKIHLGDEFAWVTRTALSLVPVLEACGIVSPFVHITRLNNVVNMNPCCIIEIRVGNEPSRLGEPGRANDFRPTSRASKSVGSLVSPKSQPTSQAKSERRGRLARLARGSLGGLAIL